MGSGGVAPQGPDVSAMSSRAMSFILPSFLSASNNTCSGQRSKVSSPDGQGSRYDPCNVTNRRHGRQVEGHLAIVPVVTIVTVFLEQHSKVWPGQDQDSEAVDVFSKHVVPAATAVCLLIDSFI